VRIHNGGWHRQDYIKRTNDKPFFNPSVEKRPRSLFRCVNPDADANDNNSELEINEQPNHKHKEVGRKRRILWFQCRKPKTNDETAVELIRATSSKSHWEWRNLGNGYRLSIAPRQEYSRALDNASDKESEALECGNKTRTAFWSEVCGESVQDVQFLRLISFVQRAPVKLVWQYSQLAFYTLA
jgi:hypothetical protein